ncbi:MAG: cadherin-like beta sandwich domain-containing protein [Oscillospiraceae bacterium]|nr:cadherin-like beta sandwich domain-containing protein [Oscillospiraceae bacterium]
MKTLKRIFSVIISIIIVSSVFCFTVSAAATSTISLSASNLKVGSTLTVTINVKANEIISVVEGYLEYNTKVLEFVSGDSAVLEGAGTVKIVGTSLDEVKSRKYSIKFKTKGVGKSSIAFKNATYVDGSSDINAQQKAITGSSVTVTVVDNKSDNADLSALKVSKGTLSPAFNKNTTKYKVLVGNTVKSCTITASAADKDAKVAIAPNVSTLTVGDNTRTITVTAPSGKTKVYTVVISRSAADTSSMENPSSDTSSETSSDEPETPTNPLEVTIGEDTFMVLSNTSGKEIPAGFTEGTALYNDKTVATAKSEDGKFELYFLKNLESGTVDYYTYHKEADEFSLLSYFTVSNKMYIILKEGTKDTVKGYYKTNINLGNTSVEAYTSTNEKLSDFYVIYCLTEGKYGYYRFDMLEITIQRAFDFDAPEVIIDSPDEEKVLSSIGEISKISGTGKVVIIALVVVVACVIALIVLLILKLYPRRHEIEEEDFEEIGGMNLFDEIDIVDDSKNE